MPLVMLLENDSLAGGGRHVDGTLYKNDSVGVHLRKAGGGPPNQKEMTCR